MTTPQSQPNQPNDELNLTTSDARIQELLEHMHEVADLGAIGALLGWDQNTALPDGAGEVRGAQMASFEGIVHERMTAARIGELLGELEMVVAQAPYSDADRGLVRQTRREYDQATKLPGGLVQEIARVGAAAFKAWRFAPAQMMISPSSRRGSARPSPCNARWPTAWARRDRRPATTPCSTSTSRG